MISELRLLPRSPKSINISEFSSVCIFIGLVILIGWVILLLALLVAQRFPRSLVLLSTALGAAMGLTVLMAATAVTAVTVVMADMADMVVMATSIAPLPLPPTMACLVSCDDSYHISTKSTWNQANIPIHMLFYVLKCTTDYNMVASKQHYDPFTQNWGHKKV